jgi:hypothetical protein
MRGGDERSGSLFSYIDLEGRVGNDQPLRAIRGIVNKALAGLAGAFSALIRGAAGLRFHPRSCFGQCYCRRSIQSARSDN